MRSRKVLLSIFTGLSLVLVGCEEDEVVEDGSYIGGLEWEDEEDYEEYRVEGDRLRERPVLNEAERELRAIKQYELVDRPIIMNTIRYIYEFDENNEGAFEGVRFITNKATDKRKVRKKEEYLTQMNGNLPEGVANIYDISKEYPYAGEDFKSYYKEVVGGLELEVLYRTKVYDRLDRAISEDDFDLIKSANLPNTLRKLTKNKETVVARYRPFIIEMDKLVMDKRKELGLEEVEYTRVDESIEDVSNYIVPERVTLYEIKEKEVENDFYSRIEEEIDKEDSE